MRWTADRLDQLERAVRDGLRVALTTRKGTQGPATPSWLGSR
jgi:hypothetical protein